MELDLKIVNGQVVTSSGIYDWGIGIKGGKIAVLGDGNFLPEAKRTIDASGKVVLPGGVDTHCHSGDPGFPYGFDNASKSAAIGGITTIIDMPIQIPLTTDVDTLNQKLNEISPKAFVDFALWGTAMPDNLAAIGPLADNGICGFKFFMQGSVSGLTPRVDDGTLLEAFQEVVRTGLAVGVHAESQEIIAHLEGKLKSEGREDPWAFIECHPIISELETVNRALFLAAQVGVKLHIFHCSIASGIDLINQARAAGQPVSVETCPHYLFLDESYLKTRGNYAKISPALRSKEEVERLWQVLREGKIDNVASDHVAFTKEFKEGMSIWDAAAGAPGIQTMFPLMLAEGVNKGKITLPQLVKVMSEGATKYTGLYPRKGVIAVGADADFAIFDLKNETEIKIEDQLELDFTLYEGMKAVYADKTIVRGEIVYENGQFNVNPGYGQFVKVDRPD